MQSDASLFAELLILVVFPSAVAVGGSKLPYHSNYRTIWFLLQLIVVLMASIAVDFCSAKLRNVVSAFLRLPVAQFVFLFFASAAIWLLVRLVLEIRGHQRVRRKLRAVEISRLRTQLPPHFLFNALTAISELGYRDPEVADFVVTQLSVLLRKSLDEEKTQEISLRDELDFLHQYLDIQRILLRDRAIISFEVEDHILQSRVPSMIVQPLAENALIHGISADGLARLRIAAYRRENVLIVDVEDQGLGLNAEAGFPKGKIGISNVRARLKSLYSEEASLELHNQPSGGVMARLKIPYHEALTYDEAASIDY